MNNLTKISSAIDMMRGAIRSKVSEFPGQDQLSEEQEEALKSYFRSTTSPLSGLDKINLFIKYPRTLKFSYGLFDLGDYNHKSYNPDAEKMDTAWRIMKELETASRVTYLNTNIPLNIMVDILDSGKLTPEAISYVVSHSDFYPDGLLGRIIDRYEDIYNMIMSTDTSILDMVRDYVQFPGSLKISVLNAKINVSMKNGNEDANSRMQEALYQFALDVSLVNNYISENVKSNPVEYDTYVGSAIAEAAYNVLESAREGKDFHTAEGLSVYTMDSDLLGRMSLYHLGQYKITEKTVKNIFEVCESNPSAKLSFQIRPKELDDDEFFVSEGVDDNLEMIILSDYQNSKAYAVGNVADISKSYQEGSYSNGFAKDLQEAAMIGTARKSSAFKSWYFNRKERALDKNRFFFDVVNAPWFEDLTSTAGNHLYRINANGQKMVKGNDEKPGELSGSTIDAAISVFQDLPPNMKVATGMKANSYFVLMSGLFPKDMILARSKEHPEDVMRIIEYIKSSEGNDGPLKDNIRRRSIQTKDKARREVPEAIEKMIEEGSATRRSLESFPELSEYALKTVDRLVDSVSKKHYSVDLETYVSAARVAKDRLTKCDILIIDRNEVYNYISPGSLGILGVSPQEASGFFSPLGSLSYKNDTIVVYSTRKDDGGIEEMIQEAVGIKSLDLDSIAQESTLWHEVAHGIIENSARVSDDDESQWIKRPNELLAMQYGNLAYMKGKLKDTFESGIPENGSVTSGLVEHLKMEIIQTFSWEFQGMSKEEALAQVEEVFEDFDADVRGMSSSMGREDRVNLLVDLFLEFYMQRLLGDKVEEDLGRLAQKMNVDPEEMVQDNAPVEVSESYDYIPQGKRDRYIEEFQRRPDYKEFMSNVQRQIDDIVRRSGTSNPELKRYTVRGNPRVLRPPFELADLLLLIYGPQGSISTIDTTKTNNLFGSVVPMSLKVDLDNLIKQKNMSSENMPMNDKTPVTKEEAEETGQFMAEMDRDYGPDWVWVAERTTGWYKKALSELSCKR